jgi:cephalosporin hydroxylase
MRSLIEAAARLARWASGRNETNLPPWVIDPIQRGTLRYTYRGVRMAKNPFDLALYTRLLWELKPRTIVEIGTLEGGSALWFVDHLAMFGIDGTVHTLDIKPVKLRRPDPRIVLHHGDARQVDAIFPARWIDALARPLLVIDDGDHTYASVLTVLRHFGPQMRRGEYIVVEDGNVGDLGIAERFDGGPVRAIREYLAGEAPFEIDRSYCDHFGRNVTWNVDGYLRRIL